MSASLPAAGKDCGKCGSAMVMGTSEYPICPKCERAYYSLELQYAQTGEGVDVDDVLKAMIEDATVDVVGIAQDGQALLKAPKSGRQASRVRKGFRR